MADSHFNLFKELVFKYFAHNQFPKRATSTDHIVLTSKKTGQTEKPSPLHRSIRETRSQTRLLMWKMKLIRVSSTKTKHFENKS